jgi:glycosyltransferase involved in cell wall biosynthesis
MIFLFSDTLYRAGGIETYLHTLALHLYHEGIPFRVVVAEMETCPLLDELVNKGINVYRQRRIPGDRWSVRQQFMLFWLSTQLKEGDWVFCVRWPDPKLYLNTVRTIHRQNAKIAVSWALAPEFYPPLPSHRQNFCQAIAETDAVISVSRCTVGQFQEIYGYQGKVQVVPYHNALFFQKAISLPSDPPWKIGYLGRLDIKQKNLDTLFNAFATVLQNWQQVELHLYGSGPDREKLESLAVTLNIQEKIIFHGGYDHRHDLPNILSDCHFFVYPSRFEGGPCFTLLELMQAGKFCVAARVGGIPDLYEGFPDAGLLVDPNNQEELSEAILKALDWISTGKVNGDLIRDRYLSGFDMTAAHQAWKSALEMN